jgi:serine/threonine protein kinase
LVFECEYRQQPAALKIFDPVFLLENPGAIEEERIRRQLDLRAHPHPHLVAIYDAGFSTEASAHYILMQHCDGYRLTDVVATFPSDRIRPIISQVASAAKHLETLGFVHRDIKPDNIIISRDLQHATLLDLGVVLPLGVSESRENTATLEFVGTPRYSPPEFILRTEDGTTDGWRAITFYQLGAVLHDLVMQHPLFHDKQPKGRLYYSVFLEAPIVDRVGISADLIALARLCLKKHPQERLAGVTWEMFDEAYTRPTREQLRGRIKATRGKSPSAVPATSATPTAIDLEKFAVAVKDGLIADNEVFPANSWAIPSADSCVLFTFAKSPAHGLHETLLVALWPYLDDQHEITRLAACAAMGHPAASILAECQNDAATVPVLSPDAAPAVGVHICTAAILAVCEEAGIKRDGVVLFHLGHYL